MMWMSFINLLLFQLAASHGNDKIVEFLLGREGIDANGVAPGEPRPPVLIAAHHGFYKV